jgi:hypothetical protein
VEFDMSQSVFRSVVSIALTLLVPAQLLGQDSASGMVYANGPAWVNGTEIPKSVAVFSGDTLQTKQDSSANIGTNGSSVMVLSDSLVKYEGSSVGVDRGSVRVSTESGFAAHACEVKASPANNTQTQYQFAHNDRRVVVIATKGDVIVDDHERSKTIKEGQQTTRDDGCEQAAKKNRKKRPGAATAAGGGILSSPTAVYTGIGIVTGITLWVLLQDDDPLSPACPDKTCK